MTVSYTGDVANGSSFGCFWKILGRWKGSVYKLIWRELIAYLCLYFVINVTYRHGMTESQRLNFEKVKVYCSKQIESIPMSFVLGFYVSLIVKRWWDQYWILPMPDSLALYISAGIHGQNERGRLLRRTIMRYTMLAYIITLQRISFRVKKRFPTLQHLVDTGLMMESEKKIFDTMEAKTKVSKFWMPIVWASNLVNLARQEGRIHSDHMVQTIVTELSEFRKKLGRVMVYDNVSVPLVYTQVVTLAVYTYFVAALIGRQWVVPKDGGVKIYPGYEFDLYFPIFLSLQFIFYIGWLKVAETLINPFGEDDDDFELNWLIDRHIKVSYMVVDEMHEEHPELLKDYYWEQKVPQSLPYNMASEQFRRTEPQGSTASMKIKLNESVYDNLPNVKRHSVIQDEVYAEYECVTDSPLADNRKNWLQRQMSRVESFRSTSSSSSLFRNRLQANGQLPNGYPQGASSHHRLSLYDRLMNRRSSKDKSSTRFPMSGNGRPINSNLSVNVGKDNITSLMPHPHSRPRVPTPDVTKENQINLMAVAPMDKIGGRVQYNNSHSNANTNGGSPISMTNPNYGGSSFMPNNTNNLNGIINGGNRGNPNIPINSPVSSTSPTMSARNTSNYSSGDVVVTQPVSTKPKSTSSSPSPPPYDATDSSTHPILTPIAEHDGSPYSTSSTSRSSRSSNYPTTTSIFGRKSSPPPQDVLPPIPTVTVTGSLAHNNSMSDKVNGMNGMSEHGGFGGKGKFHVYSAENEAVNAAAVIHELENALSNQGSIDEEPYMTIAEVNESKDESQMNHSHESAVGPTLPPPYRPSSYNSQVPSHHSFSHPPSLPLPLPPTQNKSRDLDRSPLSHSNTISSTTNISNSSRDRMRKISLGMQRQNAVVQISMDEENPPEGAEGGGGGVRKNLHSATTTTNYSTIVDHDNVDDGYDERGSYIEEEEIVHSPGSVVSSSDVNSNECKGASAKGDSADTKSSDYFRENAMAGGISTSRDKTDISDSSCNESHSSSGNSSSSNGSYNENGSIPISPRVQPNSTDSGSSGGTNIGTSTVANISKDCEVFV